MSSSKKNGLPITSIPTISSRPIQPSACEIRRRSDLFLLWIGVCILALAVGHIYMHNPHATHHELKKVGGVHGSLEGFVQDGRRKNGSVKEKAFAKRALDAKRAAGGENGSENISIEKQSSQSETKADRKSDGGDAQSEIIAAEIVREVMGKDKASITSAATTAPSAKPTAAAKTESGDDDDDGEEETTAKQSASGDENSDAKTAKKIEQTEKDKITTAETTIAPTAKPTAAVVKTETSQHDNSSSNAPDTNQNSHKIINPGDSIHPVAHLSCTDHGGPSDPSIIDEMVFWSDIPSDASYISPMYEEGKERYLTFEPDHGGWNNIRMAMETALVMSHAMGRTLVLPPEQGMYLIDKKNEGQKSQFSFNDFFHLDAIAIEHKGFKVITTEEFLKREALTGGLKDYKSHDTKFPPENRTDWNGRSRDPLFQYLRSVANTPSWDPWECALAIPATKDQSSIDELNTTLKSIMDGSYGKPKPTLEEFNGNPTPVDAPLGDRMREMLADRPGLCIYDKPLQEEKLIHMKVHGGVRLLTHFYAFIFFADWRQDLWSKRFVRDHLRYVDEIICAAARVVEAVRKHARKNTKHKPSMEDGIYDAMHVRRGDFQYTPTRLPADQLHTLSKDELSEGATLYIATDERDKTFFDIFKEHYDVVFLDDFMDVIPDVNTNYYGMIDQLVSYKSRVFYGTWWSTLSGYVNRMRGYYIAKHKLEGWEDGTMKSWYFTPEERKLQMRSYIPVRKPIYCKEFAIAWRDIDKGIDEILH